MYRPAKVPNQLTTQLASQPAKVTDVTDVTFFPRVSTTNTTFW